jgi:hypothetical protein
MASSLRYASPYPLRPEDLAALERRRRWEESHREQIELA